MLFRSDNKLENIKNSVFHKLCKIFKNAGKVVKILYSIQIFVVSGLTYNNILL